ncbi:biotin-dependent carboxyltransferase family protein [Chloroflexi bacterium]|nr:biotin-dependent carboxyltransferase family protein [Chloroflexota bacterium]
MESKNNKSSLTILEPGIFSTIQDLGRYEYQKFGVPTSGALDQTAFMLGNLILGNNINNPGIETTLLGPKIKFNSAQWICVTGANSNPMINNQNINMWAPVYVKENSILTFNQPEWGVRSYILFQNTFDLEKTMGSYSANTSLGLGGHKNGLQLNAKDKIKFINNDIKIPPLSNNFDYKKHYIGKDETYSLRVILGPHDDFFNEDSIKTLLNSEYVISPQSNRIGFRLSGPTIKHKSKSDIISEGGALGSIQIPGDGQPIVLLHDRGTTGGYPKIATISSVDIPKLAQSIPGQKITFQKIEIEEAAQIYRSHKVMLDNIVLPDEDIKIKIDKFENNVQTKSPVKLNGSKSFLIKSKFKNKQFEFNIKLS